MQYIVAAYGESSTLCARCCSEAQQTSNHRLVHSHRAHCSRGPPSLDDHHTTQLGTLAALLVIDSKWIGNMAVKGPTGARQLASSASVHITPGCGVRLPGRGRLQPCRAVEAVSLYEVSALIHTATSTIAAASGPLEPVVQTVGGDIASVLELQPTIPGMARLTVSAQRCTTRLGRGAAAAAPPPAPNRDKAHQRRPMGRPWQARSCSCAVPRRSTQLPQSHACPGFKGAHCPLYWGQPTAPNINLCQRPFMCLISLYS